MRILHIVGTMDLGGLETFIMNIYRNIDRNKIKFDFLVHSEKEGYYEPEILKLGGKVYSVSSKKVNILKNIYETFYFFKKNKYQIIHIHTNSATCITDVLISKICGVKKVIVHSHSTKTKKSKMMIHKLLRGVLNFICDVKLACSSEAASWLFGDTAEEVNIINNAIDLDLFVYSESNRRELLKSLNINEDTLVIGHVGNFSIAKNHKYLIDIFSNIEKRRDAVLLLVGKGDLKPDIENKVNDMGLYNRVFFLGQRNDIPRVLSVFDIFLFPSLYEGFPVSLVEAQASGLISYISDRITREVIITDLIKTLPLEADPKDWAEQIIDVNKNYYRGGTIQILKDKGFDIRNEADKLKELYLNLIEG